MGPDVINAPALQTAITSALEGLPPALRSHRAGLQTYLFRAAANHSSVRRAHRRKNDPEWAKAKFAKGEILYRFAEDERQKLARDVEFLVEELKEVAALAAKPNHPLAGEIVALLRGLSHRRDDMGNLKQEVMELTCRAVRAAFRAKRHDLLRNAATVKTDGLQGTLCVSLGQIVRLGRQSQNCLAENVDYWQRFVSGALDIWALREGDRLVAVLAVERDKSCVSEALGPGNVCLALEEAQRVARFCARAEWTIGARCEGLLPDFAGPILVGPLRTMIGKRVVLYAEWQHAVRIDMSPPLEEDSHFFYADRNKVLTLVFDPAKPCADEILAGPDPREAVCRFGAKWLRKIVSSVALGQAAPTLVQHRLLVLAA